MAEKTAGPQQCPVASEGADQVGFIREMARYTILLLICVYWKRQLAMQLVCGFGFEDDVDGGVGGADVRRELDDGLGDVGRALLFGDEDVPQRRGPLQTEERVGGRLDVRRRCAQRQLGY